MFPLSDGLPARRFPWATWLLIITNVAVFYFLLTSSSTRSLIVEFALVPARIDFGQPESLITFITSQFMHGGFIHIISNMWFLKIFGDNIEERVGSIPFIALYLLFGIAGNVAQYLLAPGSTIPVLGASGAVAGILGAYYVLHPSQNIKTLLFIFIFITVVNIPAWLMIIYWFVIQLVSGVGVVAGLGAGGVAWWAHIAGFVAGWLTANLIGAQKQRSEDRLWA